jgi:hypothetical protein
MRPCIVRKDSQLSNTPSSLNLTPFSEPFQDSGRFVASINLVPFGTAVRTRNPLAFQAIAIMNSYDWIMCHSLSGTRFSEGSWINA